MSNEAYKLRGTKQPISFGVEKLEGFIVDATEETVEGEELEVEDENGDVVAHFSGYGIRYKGEYVEHKEGKTSGKSKK